MIANEKYIEEIAGGQPLSDVEERTLAERAMLMPWRN